MVSTRLRRLYYGYFYGLVFGVFLTGAVLLDSKSSLIDVLATIAFSILLVAPALAATAFAMGAVADRIELVRSEPLSSQERIHREPQ